MVHGHRLLPLESNQMRLAGFLLMLPTVWLGLTALLQWGDKNKEITRGHIGLAAIFTLFIAGIIFFFELI